MGCWNQTCMLTQLPILAGDKVKVFLLRQIGDIGNGMVYPTDVCRPVTPPIDAEYNDYGSVENINENYATKLIKKACWWESTSEEFFKHLERCKQIHNPDPEASVERHGPLMFSMVPEKIYYDTISIIAEMDGTIYDKDADDNNKIIHMPMGDVIQWHDDKYFGKVDKMKILELQIEDAKAELANDKTNEVKKAKVKTLELDTMMLGMRSFDAPSGGGSIGELINSFVSHRDSSGWPNTDWMEFITDADVKVYEEFKKDMRELQLFSFGMMILRKTWMPQSGQGSQTMEFDIHAKVLTKAAEYAQKKDDWYNDED